ncbi:MAG: pilus assembly protein PilP [Bdellovibrionaceae bacterium]|nr:pilus assembly protein PilP [Pseudobdellovibrionaceae bacterium]
MRSSRGLLSILLIGKIALGAAYLLTESLLAAAQDLPPPAPGDLPPEFVDPGSAGSEPPGAVVPPSTPIQNPPTAPTPGPQPEPPIPSDLPPVQSQINVGGQSTFYYDGTGRRDPFKPYRIMTPKGYGAKSEPVDPLLLHEVDQFTLMAILWDVRKPRAIVRDPQGGRHTITTHTRIGRRSGFVAAIREGEVVIIVSADIDGSVLRETKILELKK